MDGHRTAMMMESSSACQEWSMPRPHMAYSPWSLRTKVPVDNSMRDWPETRMMTVVRCSSVCQSWRASPAGWTPHLISTSSAARTPSAWSRKWPMIQPRCPCCRWLRCRHTSCPPSLPHLDLRHSDARHGYRVRRAAAGPRGRRTDPRCSTWSRARGLAGRWCRETSSGGLGPSPSWLRSGRCSAPTTAGRR